jgi:hypothetical protein
LAASTSLTPEQRTLRARLAAHESWSNTEDRSKRTSSGYRASPASVDYWLDKVDPDGTMTPDARRRAAESKRDAYMARLAFNASRARAAKRGAPRDG